MKVKTKAKTECDDVDTRSLHVKGVKQETEEVETQAAPFGVEVEENNGEAYGAVEEAVEAKEEEDSTASSNRHRTRPAGRKRKRRKEFQERHLDSLRECRSPGHSDD